MDRGTGTRTRGAERPEVLVIKMSLVLLSIEKSDYLILMMMIIEFGSNRKAA